MTRLDQFSQDIVDFLSKHEPNMLRWIEIIEGLWPKYKFKYKDEKVFGVALSQKLKKLVPDWIKKENMFYGSLKSKPPSKEKNKENPPSKLNYWEYRKWKKEYEDKKSKQYIREIRGEEAADIEVNELDENDPDFLRKAEEIRERYRKKYGSNE